MGWGRVVAVNKKKKKKEKLIKRHIIKLNGNEWWNQDTINI
jgi:hypothetical protein